MRDGNVLVMAVRDAPRGERAREEILRKSPNARVEVMACDLADFASVRGSPSCSARHERLDVLCATPVSWRCRSAR